MAIDHKIIRNSEIFKGLDKRSSDIMRTSEYATDIKNAAYRITGAINKRKGFKKLIDIDTDCYGLVTFKNLNTSTGAISDELIVAKETTLVKIENDPISLSYSGSEVNMTFSCLLDSTSKTFKFKIFDEGTEIFDQDLGTGEEGSPVTLATLSAAMPTDFTLSIGSYTTQPAAFMVNTPRTSIDSSAAVSIDYYKETAIDKGDTSATIFTHANTSDNFQNVSFEQMNNVLYISNGIDHVMKYDGDHLYRAGLPNPPDITNIVNSGAGSSKTHGGTNDHHDYMYIYEFFDNKNNFISSQISDVFTYLATNGHDTTITLPAFPESGFDFASGNIKIKIYRSAGYDDLVFSPGANIFYHLTGKDQTVTNTTSTYTITDDIDIGDINTLFNAYKTRVKRQDPPPKGAYLAKFKDCLVISGQPSNVNNVSYSLPFNTTTSEIGSEYFPDDDNAVIVNSSFGTKITAISPLRDLLYIFHEDSIHVLAGNISEPTGIPYTVDLLTNEGGLGCISHHSITEFQNNLVFLSSQGYFSINSSNALQEISAIINPLFKDKNLVKKRAVTFNWTDKDLLMMIIPKEETVTSNIYTTSDSLIIVYDYYRGAWLQWDSLDFTAGIALSNDKLFFLSRGESNKKINQISDLGDTTDYADHATAINFEYDTNWESLGEPTIPKKFLRLKVHSFDTEETFESTSFDVDIKIQRDYNDVDLGSINFNFGGDGSAGWGGSGWGSAGWGSVPSKFVKSKLPTGKSKCTKLRFTNSTINQNVLITNYEYEIAAPYRTEIKD